MGIRDNSRLIADLAEAYAKHSPKSAAVNEKAMEFQVDGGSHALRLIEPFPPRIASAKGAWLEDEDGHAVLDFWQGHLANILGHNPEVVTSKLSEAFGQRYGLQMGFTDRMQAETAEILCRQTGAERVRFTTSGTLATMYAVLLARAFTGRDWVMKVGGGWHGGQPWGFKGVHFAKGDGGFEEVETLGLPSSVADRVLITGFNDTDMLRDHFRQYGDRLACFIVEPYIGGGGMIPALPDYLQTARELTHEYGAALILDEVISGFRFRAGNLGALYGVQPDLATFAKVMGGGMPIAATTGRSEIMDLAGRAGGRQVMFSGGTYSGHPASLLAAKTLMTYLVENESEVYPRLAALGAKARQVIEEAFAAEGIYTQCTGGGNAVIPGGSIVMPIFPYRDDFVLDKPELVFDPAVCDVTLAREALSLALMLEDVHMMAGHGAVSTAHTEEEIDQLGAACQRVASRFKAYL